MPEGKGVPLRPRPPAGEGGNAPSACGGAEEEEAVGGVGGSRRLVCDAATATCGSRIGDGGGGGSSSSVVDRASSSSGGNSSGNSSGGNSSGGIELGPEWSRLPFDDRVLNAPHDDPGRRQSSNIEAAVLLAEMVRARLKTICFCSVRKITELVLDYAKSHMRGAEGEEAVKLLGAYRGGLTPADRRRVERQLYDGTLMGVTATSSLELGVDFAELDGVVMDGFPGSLASLWQRAGRCGRSPDADALCILIAYPSAIDQWAMRHPAQLLSMGVEASIVDTGNALVLKQHLLCAAREQPLTADDEELFAVLPHSGGGGDECASGSGGGGGSGGSGGGIGDGIGSIGGGSGSSEERQPSAQLYHECVHELHAAGQLVPLGPSGWRTDVLIDRPDALVNIRSIDQERVQVIMQYAKRRTQTTLPEAYAAGGSGDGGGGDGGIGGGGESSGGSLEVHEEVVDEVESWRCWYELFEGAIYLNQGRKLEVVSWEVHAGIVRVRPSTVRYYTSCLDKITIRVLQRTRAMPLHRVGKPAERASLPPAAAPSGEGGGEAGGGETSGEGSSEADARAGSSDVPEGSPSPSADESFAAAARMLGQVCAGRVQLSLSVAGYVKRWQKTGEIFEEVPLSMPHNSYYTRACWIDLPERAPAELGRAGLSIDAGLHAAAHALLAMMPLRLSCEPGDAGCECDELRKGALWPKRLMIYDKCDGGCGVSERAMPLMLTLLRDALAMMRECPCRDGCFCCIHLAKCPEYNAHTDKRAAIALAQIILDAADMPPAAVEAVAAAARGATAAAAKARRDAAAANSDVADGRRAGIAPLGAADDDAYAREQLDSESEPPSMLGASIRRLWSLAPGGGGRSDVSRSSNLKPARGAPAEDSDEVCSECAE